MCICVYIIYEQRILTVMLSNAFTLITNSRIATFAMWKSRQT